MDPPCRPGAHNDGTVTFPVFVEHVSTKVTPVAVVVVLPVNEEGPVST